jgi:[acyl-carrier-protein] S-malonyltransferase
VGLGSGALVSSMTTNPLPNTRTKDQSMSRFAFLFPGQGSQKVGMGKALAESSAAARAVYDEVDEALGFALSKLCFEGPESELTLTANAQPAILATSIAALRVLQAEAPLTPAVLAGHSLGEYSALVAAGAIGLADAARVVRLRGQFMQEAVPAGTGAMAAILGLDAAEAEAACEDARRDLPDEVVSPANLNGGSQIVIAGHKRAVERACEAARARGAKRAMPLAVSAPFHCELMRPAADRLAIELGRIEVRDPSVPVIANVDASPHRDGNRVRELLTRQVTAPVRWEESVQRLVAMEVSDALEVGHGSVLAGLVRRIAPGLRVRAAGDPEAIAAATREDATKETGSHA